MRRPQLNLLLIGGLMAALGAGIGLSHYINSPKSTPAQDDIGLILNPAREIADFSLQNLDGEAVGKAQMAGRWQLLFFGFTHCPDVCPSTLALMRQLRQDFSEAERSLMDFVFITIDPARDTADKLKPYLAHFDPAFVGLRGDEQATADFSNKLGIAYVKVGEGENYSMDHSTALVVLNPQTQVKAYYSAPHKLDELKASISQLINR